MFKRLLMFCAVTGAVAGPYLVSTSGDLWKSIGFGKGAEKTAENGLPVDPTETLPHNSHMPGGHAGFGLPQARGGAPPVEGFAAADLAEIFQFEGSPQWVISRWPRVTAGLAELDLQGYRVPLVTGTGVDDLAGSLTYYFDKQQKATKIDFKGSTGDPRKLISLLTSRYQFKQQSTDDPALGLYQVRWNGKPTSELKVRPARVLRADQPFARYEVELALKRP